MELIVGDTTSESVVAPEAAHGPVQTWREHDVVCAIGYEADGASWLDLPNVARYRFTAPDAPVLAFPRSDVAHQTVVDGFERTVLPLALQSFGFEALHASGVLTANGVVALCGDSGVGKSTLAHVLAARGHEVWADDAVVFEHRSENVVALPLPFRPILLPASVNAFGDPIKPGPVVQAERPLVCIVVLGRKPNGSPPVTVARCRPAEALEAAITHAYCYRPDDLERNRRMMQTYLELVARVPLYGVSFVDDLDQVPVIAERVEALLG